jgi:DNA polymerase elongation subunit (family B)
MLESLQIENLVFIDIETVPQTASFSELTTETKKLWEKKASLIIKEEQTPSDVYQRAGIYAEFGKIICISAGLVYVEESQKKIRLKSFASKDEHQLLQDFGILLRTLSAKKNYSLCAHNGKEFDFPYIARRMLINGIDLPAILDTAGKKPWEVNHLDTMELWKFGDFKNYTSLELLTHVFGIPSPKNDIDGSMVASVYYEEDDLPRIMKYCERDVIAIIQLMLKFKLLPLIQEEYISIA